ncbi:hypothetical protein J7U46_17555 [Pelomonas sp. V22]|uniref:hypothetical protein n=1 Tax=Pelomonas sp. V22 TaxID=2822139 RepID=UPI0024A98BBE|nr:hypothetical protein [Pelomonas sp. V22]MDI4634872.1 hypothetical protein [Pelomonas sp. V22]
MMKTKLGRLLAPWLAACALLVLVQGPAAAATLLPDPAAAQLLSCLSRREKPPSYPSGDERRHTGLLRVQLKFVAPDKPPLVEPLANTASESMQDVVYDYLRSYRLPCMAPGQEPVVAVQEFRFDRDPGSLHALEQRPELAASCLVMPRQGPEGISSYIEQKVSKVLVVASFEGDGSEPPKVDIIYSNGSSRVEGVVRDYVASYRMPCRRAGDRPYRFQQSFIQTLGNAKPAGFRQREVDLPNFLASLKDIAKQTVSFDFKTMSCPFALEWISMQPARANQVRELGRRDPNRAIFLAWLASQELKFSGRVVEQLMGETLRIEVPCGYLQLPANAS